MAERTEGRYKADITAGALKVAEIRQNVAFSLSVKLVFVILTFAGYSSLWAAIAADTGASLLVIFNGLRLLRVEGSDKPGAA